MEKVKPKVRIFDSAFTPHCNSASLREENAEVHPTHFEWELGFIDSVPFYTDGHVEVLGEDATIWLIEPRHLRPENYKWLDDDCFCYNHILTYDKELLDKCDNALFYPLGGSSIAFDKWGIYPKTKDVCMFISDKKTTEGHKLRHQIAEEFGDRIDLYGAGVGKPVDSKFEVLKDYKYCVVVESGRSESYFTEKLIDPISVGTYPIYWGCPTIEEFFDHSPGDNQKYWQFQNLKELGELLKWPKLHGHDLINFKFEIAKKYRICEDYIFENYPFLFEANND